MNDVEALFALGSKGGLRIARALSATEWKSASEIAAGLNLHIATAVAHLSSLASADIAERRLRSGRRKAFEYRLRTTDIVIEICLAENASEPITESLVALAGFAERLAGVLGADFDALARLMDVGTARALNDLMECRNVGEKSSDLILAALVAGSVARLGRRATVGLMSAAGYDLKFTSKMVGGE